MKRSSSPSIFNFDDEEPEDFEMDQEESEGTLQARNHVCGY
jgi:hypothetical protein